MVKIKNVYFGCRDELLRMRQAYNHETYLGMVVSYGFTSAVDIYGTSNSPRMSTRIMLAICTYIESGKKGMFPIVSEDYNFYVYTFDNINFVEVETKNAVRIA